MRAVVQTCFSPPPTVTKRGETYLAWPQDMLNPLGFVFHLALCLRLYAKVTWNNNKIRCMCLVWKGDLVLNVQDLAVLLCFPQKAQPPSIRLVLPGTRRSAALGFG